MSQAPLAIVVFGCHVTHDGEPSAALGRRLQKAVQEWRRQQHATVIVSGGVVRDRPAEAIVMRAWLIRHGLPEERIVVEDQARNTFENAQLCVPLLQKAGIQRVVLVTERFHMRRALAIFRGALDRAGLQQLRVERASAPDNLRGAALWGRWLREVVATWRDRRKLGPYEASLHP